MTTCSVAGRDGLLEILSWARPHDSETERRFCAEYLDNVEGMQQDGFGNRYIRIGDAPVLWSCHVDTVAKAGRWQGLHVDTDGVCGLKGGKPGQSLGADDGVGVWIMLNMIAAQRPGLYVFHRGEEVGCLGSSFIARETPELLDDIQIAMAFDRAGYSDVITHQMAGRTASDAFALSFAAQVNPFFDFQPFKPCDGGVYTDTNEYAELIPECSNLSVGYFGQHGPKETQDLPFAENVLEAMLALDTSLLVVERDPSDESNYMWGGYSLRRKRTGPEEDMEDFAAMVEQNPYLAAHLLRKRGVSRVDFAEEVWARDDWGA